MKRFAGCLSMSALLFCLLAPTGASALVVDSGHKGDIEFRVGSSTSTVVANARVIVINHEGSIVATGLTNAQGTWDAKVPMYKADWNKKFEAKGVVSAIVVADGFNEQAVYIIPITEHTVQPVILQPIQANRRNAPSTSLGNFSTHDLKRYIDRYASELKLKRQAPIPGDPEYAPWSPQQQQ
ncbi:hypothetical protein C7445_101194 [Alicyclobacillus sacchari]|uniref:Bacterial Ig domain-containing protein n=1 Tax=Alicyclobacillus sacchari TaxID=392010 RepID=A0A4R8LU69_9BACL|nr:carboxypeptidase-like regulatory domain-containing protein [Alicyclobacillus sacchari]TDY51194.1 hypothetical protein C7445_101194 [Alicyclobacillus sacchari]GMA56459.1 hypothetical protein GCM10025858_09620 [Alicyclobacillus sacchari]